MFWLKKRDKLPNVMDGAYVINLKYGDVRTHWIALFWRITEIVYFDSFIVAYIVEEIEKIIGNKKIKPTFFEYIQTIQ